MTWLSCWQPDHLFLPPLPGVLSVRRMEERACREQAQAVAADKAERQAIGQDGVVLEEPGTRDTPTSVFRQLSERDPAAPEGILRYRPRYGQCAL